MLENDLFKYYKAADESTSAAAMTDPSKVEDSDMKGCIFIQGCKVVPLAPVDAGGRSFCFQLTPQSNKIFLICAPDEEARDQWVKAIQAHAERAPMPAAPSEEAPPDPQPEDVTNIVGKEVVTLADFELLKVIGRGTYGKVMQVRRRDTNEILAMKVLKKGDIFTPSKAYPAGDPKNLQHTISERNVLALVNNEAHPFILGLRYAFHTPAKLYYVLNFCNGGDLYYLLNRCKKFKEQQARFYASEVFLALQHLHKLGVIYRARRRSNASLPQRPGRRAWSTTHSHPCPLSRCPGDLKTENVLLDIEGHVKLTDFGLSTVSPQADTFCGTPVYIAPEIWNRKTYSFEVDWWSLGCVLYEMVCGVPPFWGESIRAVYEKVTKSTPKFPGMSPECQSVIEGLLQREPTARLGGKENGNDIKEHEFFQLMAWDELLEKKVKPPFKSKSTNLDDTNNFSKNFTNQKPLDSVSSASQLNEYQQAHFEGFTYNPEMAGLMDEAAEGGRKSQYTQPRPSNAPEMAGLTVSDEATEGGRKSEYTQPQPST